MIDDDELCAVDPFGRICGLFTSDTLTPPMDDAVWAFHTDSRQQDVAMQIGAEAGAERRDQIESDAPELEIYQTHSGHPLTPIAHG